MSDMMNIDNVSDQDRSQASEKNRNKMSKFVAAFAKKTGSYLHPQKDITEFLIIGLAKNIDDFGRPLCPCNYYEDKSEEVKSSTWICPCEEMQKWKYCHWLLFCNEEGLPITEHLPPDHEGHEIYGDIKDPDPSKGLAMARLQEKQGRTIEKK